LAASLIIASAPALAAALPEANKLFVLVPGANCDPARLDPKLNAVAKAMVSNKATTRVVVDRPADRTQNLDMMGKPSPLIAALEVLAPPAALHHLAEHIESALAPVCAANVYLVFERPLLVPTRAWPLGQRSPDPKVISTQIRKDGLSLEQFDATWSGPHAQLALAWRREAGITNGHYVQNLVLAHVPDDAPEIDGIGEGERGATVNPPAQQIRMQTAAHAQTFSDVARSQMMIAQEVILK
jgi:hypothetical protein